MERNNCRHISLRFSYDNPEHIRIMDMLDDLNTDVHKSKNQFIITAISYYMDAIKSGDLTYSGRREQEEMEAAFATREYVDDAVARMSGTVRTELYEDMVRFLGSMAFGTALNRGMTVQPEQEPQNRPQGGAYQSRTDYETMHTADTAEDIAETLGTYDNVLKQVMDWSED